ncbi:MAG: gfo/Idh/MocA family oxidoreductase [Candidatus Omnitrophota bacterium]|jgi:predicted dehydrogenase|nr:MAG: gfo/Idh/MocA family oxidoreductase [Candidatus Omnitrophota bacterium]
MTEQPTNSRRDFLKKTGLGIAAGLTAMEYRAFAAEGANNQINIGIIGVGGRGSALLDWARRKEGVKFTAVCDVYVKRRKDAAKQAELDPENEKDCTGDYREVLNRSEVDAVIIATPDHWHAPIAIAAMKKGKDVYLEKPMTRTVEEAKDVHQTRLATNRILQVGSQTTSSDQWWKAKKAIQDGMIGKLIMSQGSYHRNSTEGEWNWSIDPNAGPDAEGDNYIDWDTWLGSAKRREWDSDRFFRFRKFWDYSGGIATDLFYHVMAPLNICWPEPQFPYKVMASGGIYVFKDTREVPDTFALMAEYPGEHQVVLSSSMANNMHIPGLIRGHEGTIMMVPHGEFEGRVDHITVTAQRPYRKQFAEKFGKEEIQLDCEPRMDHMDNFLQCVRTREKPVLDTETAYKAMVTIAMSVESYRTGKVLYFDEKREKVIDRAPKRKEEKKS